MQHPVDGRAWKNFDTKYLNFAKEPRIVRLGLAADGFNPFENLSQSYSMYPVILTTYNLPPWLCMKEISFMLTLIIPGPKSPGKDIDVYLRHLIDDQKDLWANPGVEAIDVATCQKFNMRAMVLWIINDFPARSSLSGWSTQGYKACPTCNEDTPSTQYLPADVAKPIIELCLCFKQICSQTLMKDDILKAQSKVIDIQCNLELIYPPGFFDIMIHLVIHLPLEALKGGPIRPRWMYPFERFMKKLKSYDVTMKFNRPDHNVDCPPLTCQFQVFRSICKSIGLRSFIRIDHQELKKVICGGLRDVSLMGGGLKGDGVWKGTLGQCEGAEDEGEVWNDITKIGEEIDGFGVELIYSCVGLVRDGRDIRFLIDRWVGSGNWSIRRIERVQYAVLRCFDKVMLRSVLDPFSVSVDLNIKSPKYSQAEEYTTLVAEGKLQLQFLRYLEDQDYLHFSLCSGIGVEVKREKQLKQKRRGFWLGLALPVHPKVKVTNQGDCVHKHDEEKDDLDSCSSKTIDDLVEKEKRDIFKIHSTLNTGQKQELAKKLHLLPRQIEVWFQNRRARTKLKQIEQECALLKKCCETLSEENRRLKKDLREALCSSKLDHHQQLKQLPPSFYIRYSSNTETRHQCDNIGKTGEDMKPVAAVNGSTVVQEQDNRNKKNATATLLRL
nr:hypothetical protein [Tanacetum cinerariifolium]